MTQKNLYSPYAAEHAAPNGAGDSRPTAIQIVKDEGMIGVLEGKCAFITGCSSGIGIETARALHVAGANVFMQVRNVQKGEEVIKDIQEHSSSKGKIELIKMELGSFESIRKGSPNQFRELRRTILILDLGVMATPETKTEDGFELQLATNHLAHFLLFQLLKPTLWKSATPSFNSRVVCLSSNGHHSGRLHFDNLNLENTYDPWAAYGQSKLANILMANYIDRVYGPKGIHAASVHPGLIKTGLDKFMDPTLLEAMKTKEQGAATTLWAATGKVWEGKGGKYLENCAVAEPAANASAAAQLGYAPHAYDEKAENKLWEVSCKLVGVRDD
ncbi:short chain dehydrogenase [Lineolata rhizophorae]|uniref:Short chain dehydrogenase n=1 Tax=Lineolata rhizophorae TaxID=578093 RepID=A0A6A6NS87_9PEZI|nr:short chain dehydrogenase [Lineolata rhizophorae]